MLRGGRFFVLLAPRPRATFVDAIVPPSRPAYPADRSACATIQVACTRPIPDTCEAIDLLIELNERRRRSAPSGPRAESEDQF